MMDTFAPTRPPRGSTDDAAQLLAMINGAWVTQVIRTACVLQLPEHMAQGTADTPALAAASGCCPDALQRLLLAMTALDLCESVATQGWRLTRVGELLCREAPGSLHHWALHAGGGLWQRLGELPETVRTGASWPQRHNGVGGYERLVTDAQARTVFHHAMVELTRQAAPAIVPVFELDSVRCVVDVGGGQGELLGAVLQQAPAARGVLHDQALHSKALSSDSIAWACWLAAESRLVTSSSAFRSAGTSTSSRACSTTGMTGLAEGSSRIALKRCRNRPGCW